MRDSSRFVGLGVLVPLLSMSWACTGGERPRELGPASPVTEPVEVEVEPAPPSTLRRLVVDGSSGCVSDADERLLCWGSALWPRGELPASQAVLRTAAVVDLGEPEAKIVDVALFGRVCALFDDEVYRCRHDRRRNVAYSNVPAGSGASKVIPDYSIERMAEHDCVLAGTELRCGGAETEPIATDVIDFDLSLYHGCALRKDGSVVCWATEASPFELRPTQTIPGAVALELEGRLCVRTDAGKLWCSRDGLGELVELPYADVVDFGVGLDHYCVLTAAGKVSCAGSNGFAQLGAGDSVPHDEPVEVPLPGRARELAVGLALGCALVDDAIWCWGGDPTPHGPVPTESATVELEATKLMLSGDLTCARLLDDTVQCWGAEEPLYRDRGGGIVAASRPTPVTTAIPVDAYAFSALLGDDTLVYGDVLRHLGDRPLRVAGTVYEVARMASNDLDLCIIDKDARLECLRQDEDADERRFVPNREIPPLAKVDAIGMGDLDVCAITRGRVRCLALPLEERDRVVWVEIPAARKAVAVVVSDNLTCALRPDGNVVCWDSNYDDDDNHYVLDPDEVFELGLRDVVELAAGEFGLCVRTRAGVVGCGTPSPQNPTINVEIEAGAVELAGGRRHFCVRVDADGSGTSERIECRGANYYGQLGELSSNVMLKPTAIALPN